MYKKAGRKTPVLQDLPVVNTTNAIQADIIDQNKANNSTTSTGKNQQQKKDTEEGATENISINIVTKI